MIDYLQTKGYSFKSEGKERVCRCPFCDDTSAHCYVNVEKQVFYCHKCSESGNIWKLKRHFGDLVISKGTNDTRVKVKPQKDKEIKLKNNMNIEAYDFLTKERGLTKAIIDKFNLGLSEGSIAFPYYKDGKLINIKYRSIKGKEFRREKGCESGLFNVDSIDKQKDLLITEGEFDCMSAVQMGFDNSISVSVGAGSFIPEWCDFFDECTGEILIAFDNDEKGEEGAEKISEKIGKHRCKRVKLPLKDLNECLMAGFTKDDLSKWINDAVEWKMSNLVHVTSIMGRVEDLYKGKEGGKGLQLEGWNDFNERLGGLRESDITIVTGDTGSGKSTFTLNLTYQLLKQGESILVASTEMPSAKVVSKLFSMYSNKLFHDLTEDECIEAMSWFNTKKLFFVDVHGQLSVSEIQDYIRYCKRKYDVKFVLLDHLHFFLGGGSDSMVAEIENFMRGIVSVALETGVNVLLVSHPSKLNNPNGVVNMNDLKGASAIKQDAHNVISVWRDRKAEIDGRNEVVIDMQKVRDDSGVGGQKRYIFMPESQRYFENEVSKCLYAN